MDPDHSYGLPMGWEEAPAEADLPRLLHFGSET